MYPEIDILINMVIEEGVKIVFTSAGNPKTWTEHLHEHGIIVAHVVASTKFAAKCEEAGVDAIVAEDSKQEDITDGRKRPPYVLFQPSDRSPLCR